MIRFAKIIGKRSSSKYENKCTGTFPHSVDLFKCYTAMLCVGIILEGPAMQTLQGYIRTYTEIKNSVSLIYYLRLCPTVYY